MAGFLRFTRDDYDSITQACRSLPPGDSSLVFQVGLTAALREVRPVLAERIANMAMEQVRLIREHLRSKSVATAQIERTDVPTDGAAGFGLSFHEWRVLSQVCALVFLFSETPLLCKEALVRRIGEEAPQLAEKLAGLSEEQVLSLYRRAKAGRRWCP